MGQVTVLPAFAVTARQLVASGESPWSTLAIEPTQLMVQPGQPLDEVLRSVPGFSLFRRSSSRTAHPTAQGVTFRGLGPSGASRALVLLDGVPLNDPFGGWINWSAIDPATIARVEITLSSGAGPWGSGALGGTIHLLSSPGDSGSSFSTAISSLAGRSASLRVSTPVGPGYVAGGLAIDQGVRLPVLRADQRGPIDTRAYADTARYAVRSGVRWGETEAGLRASYFREKRGNGTPLAVNQTLARDFSAWFSQSTGDLSWELRGWHQQRAFESTFTSVNLSRTAESVALDQYAVPTRATGLSGLGRVARGRHTLIVGADARAVRGGTHERFRDLGAGFTRNREAGGSQQLAGIFLEDQLRVNAALRLTLGGRLDMWELNEGRRIERDLVTGASTRSENYADRSDRRVSWRAGLNYEPAEACALRVATYTGFRAPTLNELYRPFRVRNDITEANAALQPETLTGAELGATWRPSASWELKLTGYDNRLHDLIANTTLAVGPAIVPGFDPVPTGGVLRQRSNAGQARVRGFEFSAAHKADALVTTLNLTLMDAHWENLTGPLFSQRLVQTPRWTAAAGLVWRPAPAWSVSAQGRASGRQFEDDLNSIRLGTSAQFDVVLSYDLPTWTRPGWGGGRSTLRVGVENIFAEIVETAKTTDGLVSIGGPRLICVEWQIGW
jgi:outer membrane receptor protein involved in Fe transport